MAYKTELKFTCVVTCRLLISFVPFILQRVIVVCPSSLVSNWAKEFDKWIGKASQPKRLVVQKGGENGLKIMKAFVPVKPQKTESE